MQVKARIMSEERDKVRGLPAIKKTFVSNCTMLGINYSLLSIILHA
jgi:hypothetical protein